jgi:hypothetical protein
MRDHGWMQDRGDPHARERAYDMARRDPPPGVSPQAAAVAIAEVLDGIGDTCPECLPEEACASRYASQRARPQLTPAELAREDVIREQIER